MDSINAIRVTQWLPEWDAYSYDPEALQRKPEPQFYLASVSGQLLRRLSGIHRREADRERRLDTHIQRAHDQERSQKIARFIIAGYPWAQLNTSERKRFGDLQKPGWLPTAIVANVLGPESERDGAKVAERNLVTILDEGGAAPVRVNIPEGADDANWLTDGELPPIEIIDGQHRLLAFDEPEMLGKDFHLPVVLFHDLDISWQAYLFWTINITPKRISPSFAYDLFPLLRTQDWLEHAGGPNIYRETRAQELTEVLWNHPASPWKDRIGMLGRERGKVSQAAFIRSLVLSFVRPYAASEGRTGGLFGAELHHGKSDVLNWNRAQQAAYLIRLWADLSDAVREVTDGWALAVREASRGARQGRLDRATPAAIQSPVPDDEAFSGDFSLLATDQGVRGFLQVANDLSYILSTGASFSRWRRERTVDPVDLNEVSEALAQLEDFSTIVDFSKRLAKVIARFDWRSAALPGLTEQDRANQSLYKGGTGYREVRRQLLFHVAAAGDSQLGAAASSLISALRYGS